jgi:2'-5' RNA ligase
VRLFVAAYPPVEVVKSLLDQLGAMKPKGLKLSPPEHVHLTLQFIGDTELRDLEEVQESVLRAASGLAPATIRVEALISLPERGRARLVAAVLEPHPTISELHRRLAMRLAKNARERSGEHFLAHMTLGRYPGGGGERIEASVIGPIPFEIREAVLVQSILRPQGAEHRPVATFSLK